MTRGESTNYRIFSTFILCCLIALPLACETAGSGDNGNQPVMCLEDCNEFQDCVSGRCLVRCSDDVFCETYFMTSEWTCMDGYCKQCTAGKSRQCGETDVGVCELGTQLCSSLGLWNDCQGAVLPSDSEACDGLDNNCNGFIDESGCPHYDYDENNCGGFGNVCQSLPHRHVNCLNGVCVEGDCEERFYDYDHNHDNGCEYECVFAIDGEPTEEVCDGKDNDCDGQIDEEFYIGEQCTALGLCGSGVWECAADGTRICSTAPGGSQDSSTSEICDGEDNDCDGVTDEDFGLRVACVGVGECGAGLVECAGPNSTRCSSNPGGSGDQSGPELCDGLDNNCDGQVDETFHVGMNCLGDGVCGAGVWECESLNMARCSTMPGGSEDMSSPELCNGEDDNCDGFVDEIYFVDWPCPGIGTCGPGVIECLTETEIVCSSNPGGSADNSSEELCDGLDNDCDQRIDNGFNIGTSCNGMGLCGLGVRECHGVNESICSTESGGSQDESAPEICDGLDNDCDGEIDEDFPIGGACSGVGECPNGVWECSATHEVVCSTNPGGSAYVSIGELCNGLDDDCDSLIDEDYYIDVPCLGLGTCGWGVAECLDETHIICSTNPGASEDNSSEELCDGLDNDCDERVDEDFHLGEICNGTGECGMGVMECHGLDESICSTEPGGSLDESVAEVCDGLDNDCDGLVDEDFPLGASCAGVGECSDGVWECSLDGGTVCSTNPGGSAYVHVDELCNGLDDDCDSQIDEDYGIGFGCFGIGTCGLGTIECLDETHIICSVNPGGSEDASSEELCDGLDNDCDEQIDEGFQVGEPCNGVGECGWGVMECRNVNESVCSTDINGSASEASAELCDGLDNDCDGETDETYPLGVVCWGTGACFVQGTYECNEDHSWVICSTGPGGTRDQSSLESCRDLIDNDCDGQVNEFCVCTPEDTRPCGETETGVCTMGIEVCLENPSTLATSWGACNAVVPSDEICDGLDNNCDGDIDETCACVHGEVQACGTNEGVCEAGTQQCVHGVWNQCSDVVGTEEICDGLDNNCDGRVDEVCVCQHGVTEACGSDVGECVAGTRECVEGFWTDCTDVGPSHELCNDLDDDCDGDVDEDFTVGDPCSGQGVCGNGVLECASTVTVRCSTEPGGSADGSSLEICDGLDNDCDGEVDEDYYVGTPCVGLGACGVGDYECASETSYRCSTAPGGSQDMSSNESCFDLVDNDCDGSVNEGCICDDPSETLTCGSDTGICQSGIQRCLGTSWGPCEGQIESLESELCNGLDDDCDGQVDETCPCVHGEIKSCGSDVGECRSGTQQCVNGAWSACSDTQGSEEICDGKDNDCDGQIDEVCICVHGDSVECGSNVGECVKGVQECVRGVWTTCTDTPPGFEYCNGLDDDCDGNVDEDFSVGQACTGVGACGQGVIECNGALSTGCSVNPGGSADASTLEICDGLDNDCDGSVDEDFFVGIPCTPLGVCGAGVYECLNTTMYVCSTHPGGSQDMSSVEVCLDRLDNDCDGSVDEDCECHQVGAQNPDPCGPDTNLGICQYGTQTCQADGTWGACVDPIYPAEQEFCNQLDDDCDGRVDEDFNLMEDDLNCGVCGNVCDPGGVTHATWDCNAGFCNYTCDYGYHEVDNDWQNGCEYACTLSRGGGEFCDSIDNNCDGDVDEPFIDDTGSYNVSTAHCGACYHDCSNLAFVDQVSCIGTGVCQVDSCQAGYYDNDGLSANGCEYQCSPNNGGQEACDSIDNDCDGQVDEGCTQSRIFCYIECPTADQSVYANWGGPPYTWNTDAPNATQGGLLEMTVSHICERGQHPDVVDSGWADFNCRDRVTGVWGNWSLSDVQYCHDENGVPVAYQVQAGVVDPVGEAELVIPGICPR